MKKLLIAFGLTAVLASAVFAEASYYPALSNEEQLAFDVLKQYEDMYIADGYCAVNNFNENQPLTRVEAGGLASLANQQLAPDKAWSETKAMSVLGSLIKKRRLFVRLNRHSLE